MSQPDTKTAPAVQPEARSVPKYEFFTIIGTIVGIGIALGALLLTTTGRIEARLDSAIVEAAAERRAFEAQAAADRRASDAKMDEFRKRMDESRAASDAKMDEFRKRMDESRAASDAKMDEFRRHMQRLGERQALLEGQREGAAQQ